MTKEKQPPKQGAQPQEKKLSPQEIKKLQDQTEQKKNKIVKK